MTQFARRRIAKPQQEATSIAFKQQRIGQANSKAAALMSQAYEMTRLKPAELADRVGANRATLWKESSGIQDMGSLRRLVEVLQELTSGGGTVTLVAGELKITVEREVAISDSDVSRRDVSAPLARH